MQTCTESLEYSLRRRPEDIARGMSENISRCCVAEAVWGSARGEGVVGAVEGREGEGRHLRHAVMAGRIVTSETRSTDTPTRPRPRV